jgi:hypothetical protein
LSNRLSFLLDYFSGLFDHFSGKFLRKSVGVIPNIALNCRENIPTPEKPSDAEMSAMLLPLFLSSFNISLFK